MITPDEIADASDEIRAAIESLACFPPVIDAPEKGEFTCLQAMRIAGMGEKSTRQRLEEQIKLGTLVKREVVMNGRLMFLYRVK